MSLNDEMRRRIAADIQQFGVFLFGISEGACDICSGARCAAHAGSALYRNPDDAFVYTVGQHTRSRPEIVVLVGPTPGEPAADNETVQTEMRGVSLIINHMVKNWDTKPLREHHTLTSATGRSYVVVPTLLIPPTAKEVLTAQTTEYYGHERYEILVAIATTPLRRGSGPPCGP